MHILCTICSDLVNQAESLYVTKCGHIFHHQCLAQWIERSKSCPQCRNKVTERCMFRMYPTVSSESCAEDAATLQSRLDDAMLQLRTQRASLADLQDKLAALSLDLNKKDELLRATEKRLASRESAAAALREQLEYARLQADGAQRLRNENDALNKNLQTLNGLQKVLNATAAEVEETLRGYSDLRTLATFAAALKRALCDSEAKKRSCRELQRSAEQRLAAQRARYDDLHAKLVQVQEQLTVSERKYLALKHKRKAGDSGSPRSAKQQRAEGGRADGEPDLNDAIVADKDAEDSLPSIVPDSDSPYLRLKQSGLPLCALQQRRQRPVHLKPSEFALLSAPRTSIFHRPAPAPLPPLCGPEPGPGPGPGPAPAPPDGLGGRSRPDVFPTPLRPPVPRLTAKHRLKRPSAGSGDIARMFAAQAHAHAQPGT